MQATRSGDRAGAARRWIPKHLLALPERPLWRALFGLGLGALLFSFLMLELPLRAGAPAASEPAVWLADRDADALIGLDAGLFHQRRFELRRPVLVEARAGGGGWVVSAAEGTPLGRHELLAFDGRRAPAVVAGGQALGPILDLELLPNGGALVVEMGIGQPGRVLRFEPPSGAAAGSTSGGAAGGTGPVVGPAAGGQLLLAASAVSCAAARSTIGTPATPGSVGGAQELATRVLVGDWNGGLTLLEDGAVVATRALGGELGDLAIGPGGTWWALDVAGRRLILLDANLGILWQLEHGLATESLAAVSGEERVWLADTTVPLVRRYGPGGSLELEVGAIASDAGAAAPSGAGGLWLTTPGALLNLGASGEALPGQGGFEQLVDLARRAGG